MTIKEDEKNDLPVCTGLSIRNTLYYDANFHAIWSDAVLVHEFFLNLGFQRMNVLSYNIIVGGPKEILAIYPWRYVGDDILHHETD